MTILSLIPDDLKDFLREVEGLGFSLCLVGGASRDFIMTSSLSPDLDFEIRNEAAGVLKSFLRQKRVNFQELPYDITRVDFKGYDLEFSTPRQEIQIPGNKSHHHFEARLNPKLSYQEAFKRRDFTLNAIGIELDIKNNKEITIDPFGGVGDLENKILKEISDDFFLDSVRFLRLIRFSIKYGFSIDQNLSQRLNEFDLSALSRHHFIEEMLKSKNAGLFIDKFNELVILFKLTLPEEFRFWTELHFSDGSLSKEDILAKAYLQKPQTAKMVSEFFALPEKKLKDLISYHNSWVLIKGAAKNDFEEIIKKSFSEITEPGLLREMKNLEEKKEWQKYFTEDLPVSNVMWDSIKVESSELEAIPVQMRSYLRFYKALQKSFKA